MLNNLFSFPAPKPPEYKINTAHPQARSDLAAAFRIFLSDMSTAGKEIILLCIGTDRSTGDALGPLTGTRFRSLHSHPHIFGTLDDPVHAANLPATLTRIHAQYPSPYIVAIDACLGKLENIGCVTVGKGALKPGAAVNKDLPPVGDMYVTGIVNVGGFMEHLVLQSTRLHLVMSMADIIAYGLAYSLGRQESRC